MEIRIENIGKISNARIKLDGITIIAGNNNTGKSTIGKTVFSLFNSLDNINLKLKKQREEIIQKEKEKYGIGDSFQFLREDYPSNVYNDSILKKVNEINNFDDIEAIKYNITQFFNGNFKNQINSLYEKPNTSASVSLLDNDKKLKIIFEKNKCTSYESDLNINNSAILIDDPFILDNINDLYFHDRRNLYYRSYLVNRLLTSNQDNELLQDAMNSFKINSIIKMLSEIIPGYFYYDGTWKYKDKSEEGRFDIQNLSAGLKSFALLKMLIDRGGVMENDVIIFDEPEIHLHPEWQVKYAELIVLLQKMLNLSIIVTSHSTFFIDSLYLFSRKYETVSLVNSYLFKDSDNSIIAEDVTNDLDKIYEVLSSPIDYLQTLRYELNERS